MRKAAISIILISIAFLNSGCATILGGIIGHQSGEACAGIAIGAAIDFGDDVARGISLMLADADKEFQEKSSLNTEEGTICLPAIPFTTKKMVIVKENLQQKMVENGWTSEVVEKTAKTGWFCRDKFHERWRCTTADGEVFELRIDHKQDKAPSLKVTVPEGSSADKATITAQIYKWLGEISKTLM